MRDVEKVALAMPGATRELDDDGRPTYSVHGKFFCFHRRPARTRSTPRPANGSTTSSSSASRMPMRRN